MRSIPMRKPDKISSKTWRALKPGIYKPNTDLTPYTVVPKTAEEMKYYQEKPGMHFGIGSSESRVYVYPQGTIEVIGRVYHGRRLIKEGVYSPFEKLRYLNNEEVEPINENTVERYNAPYGQMVVGSKFLNRYRDQAYSEDETPVEYLFVSYSEQLSLTPIYRDNSGRNPRYYNRRVYSAGKVDANLGNQLCPILNGKIRLYPDGSFKTEGPVFKVPPVFNEELTGREDTRPRKENEVGEVTTSVGYLYEIGAFDHNRAIYRLDKSIPLENTDANPRPASPSEFYLKKLEEHEDGSVTYGPIDSMASVELIGLPMLPYGIIPINAGVVSYDIRSPLIKIEGEAITAKGFKLKVSEISLDDLRIVNKYSIVDHVKMDRESEEWEVVNRYIDLTQAYNPIVDGTYADVVSNGFLYEVGSSLISRRNEELMYLYYIDEDCVKKTSPWSAEYRAVGTYKHMEAVDYTIDKEVRYLRFKHMIEFKDLIHDALGTFRIEDKNFPKASHLEYKAVYPIIIKNNSKENNDIKTFMVKPADQYKPEATYEAFFKQGVRVIPRLLIDDHNDLTYALLFDAETILKGKDYVRFDPYRLPEGKEPKKISLIQNGINHRLIPFEYSFIFDKDAPLSSITVYEIPEEERQPDDPSIYKIKIQGKAIWKRLDKYYTLSEGEVFFDLSWPDIVDKTGATELFSINGYFKDEPIFIKRSHLASDPTLALPDSQYDTIDGIRRQEPGLFQLVEREVSTHLKNKEKHEIDQYTGQWYHDTLDEETYQFHRDYGLYLSTPEEAYPYTSEHSRLHLIYQGLNFSNMVPVFSLLGDPALIIRGYYYHNLFERFKNKTGNNEWQMKYILDVLRYYPVEEVLSSSIRNTSNPELAYWCDELMAYQTKGDYQKLHSCLGYGINLDSFNQNVEYFHHMSPRQGDVITSYWLYNEDHNEYGYRDRPDPAVYKKYNSIYHRESYIKIPNPNNVRGTILFDRNRLKIMAPSHVTIKMKDNHYASEPINYVVVYTVPEGRLYYKHHHDLTNFSGYLQADQDGRIEVPYPDIQDIYGYTELWVDEPFLTLAEKKKYGGYHRINYRSYDDVNDRYTFTLSGKEFITDRYTSLYGAAGRGDTVVLKDSQQNVIMKTEVQRDGQYRFDDLTLIANNYYSLHIETKWNLNIDPIVFRVKQSHEIMGIAVEGHDGLWRIGDKMTPLQLFGLEGMPCLFNLRHVYDFKLTYRGTNYVTDDLPSEDRRKNKPWQWMSSIKVDVKKQTYTVEGLMVSRYGNVLYREGTYPIGTPPDKIEESHWIAGLPFSLIPIATGRITLQEEYQAEQVQHVYDFYYPLKGSFETFKMKTPFANHYEEERYIALKQLKEQDRVAYQSEVTVTSKEKMAFIFRPSWKKKWTNELHEMPDSLFTLLTDKISPYYSKHRGPFITKEDVQYFIDYPEKVLRGDYGKVAVIAGEIFSAVGLIELHFPSGLICHLDTTLEIFSPGVDLGDRENIDYSQVDQNRYAYCRVKPPYFNLRGFLYKLKPDTTNLIGDYNTYRPWCYPLMARRDAYGRDIQPTAKLRSESLGESISEHFLGNNPNGDYWVYPRKWNTVGHEDYHFTVLPGLAFFDSYYDDNYKDIEGNIGPFKDNTLDNIRYVVNGVSYPLDYPYNFLNRYRKTYSTGSSSVLPRLNLIDHSSYLYGPEFTTTSGYTGFEDNPDLRYFIKSYPSLRSLNHGILYGNNALAYTIAIDPDKQTE